MVDDYRDLSVCLRWRKLQNRACYASPVDRSESEFCRTRIPMPLMAIYHLSDYCLEVGCDLKWDDHPHYFPRQKRHAPGCTDGDDLHESSGGWICTAWASHGLNVGQKD